MQTHEIMRESERQAEALSSEQAIELQMIYLFEQTELSELLHMQDKKSQGRSIMLVF
jgi:hypothetical protein